MTLGDLLAWWAVAGFGVIAFVSIVWLAGARKKRAAASRDAGEVDESKDALRNGNLAGLWRRTSGILSSIVERMRKWRYCQEFTSYLLWSLGVWALLAVLGLLSIGRSFEYASLDLTLASASPWAPGPGKDLPFVFLEIDNASMDEWSRGMEWGRPAHVPRAPLGHLIELVASQGPKLIVVDIEVARQRDAGSIELREALRRVGADESAPPIVLASALAKSRDGRTVAEPNHLDTVVANSKRLFWAGVTYERDRDGLVRRWALWETDCADPQNPRTLPSIQLVAVATLMAGREGYEQVVRGLSPSDATCPAGILRDGKSRTIVIPPAMGRSEALAIDAQPDYRQRTIAFFFGSDRSSDGDDEGPILGFLRGQVAKAPNVVPPWPSDGKFRPHFEAFSAAAVLNELSDGKEVSQLKDAIVVIGVSDDDSRDFFETPIGRLTGAEVIANSIQTLWAFGELDQSKKLGILTKLALIVVSSAVFAFFVVVGMRHFSGAGLARARILTSLFAMVLIYGGVLPLAIYGMHRGVWLEFGSIQAALFLKDLLSNMKTALGVGAENETEAVAPSAPSPTGQSGRKE